jgi:hypothetical protein
MIPNPEVANAAPEVADAVDPTVASFATLMHRGIERQANLQKATLDVVGQQTADINATMRKSIKVPAELSGSSFLDFTGQAVEGWIVAHKNVLDLMVEQSAHAAEAANAGGINVTKSVASLSEFVQKAAERAVEAQKAMLDVAANQNKAVSEVIQKQANVAGRPVAKAIQSIETGMSTLIDTNREFLDTASKLTKSTARA